MDWKQTLGNDVKYLSLPKPFPKFERAHVVGLAIDYDDTHTFLEVIILFHSSYFVH